MQRWCSWMHGLLSGGYNMSSEWIHLIRHVCFVTTRTIVSLARYHRRNLDRYGSNIPATDDTKTQKSVKRAYCKYVLELIMDFCIRMCRKLISRLFYTITSKFVMKSVHGQGLVWGHDPHSYPWPLHCVAINMKSSRGRKNQIKHLHMKLIKWRWIE